MSGYLERLKNLNIPLPPTDKTDKSSQNLPSVSFVSFVSPGDDENFLGEGSPGATPSVSFVSAPPGESVDFSLVRCSDCRHAKPATATDPYSWHLCGADARGWWGMAPHRCQGWEARP